MAQLIVNILKAGFIPDPATVSPGDSIVWNNSTIQLQDARGATFATGPIPAGSASLPINFPVADPGQAYRSSTGLQGTVVVIAAAGPAAVHWPQVRALFTDEDVDHMGALGLDLSDQATVCQNADEILTRVTSDGGDRMPPPPREKWTANQIDLLRNWKNQGCPA